MPASRIVMFVYIAYWIFLLVIVHGFEKKIGKLEEDNLRLRKIIVEAGLKGKLKGDLPIIKGGFGGDIGEKRRAENGEKAERFIASGGSH